MFDFKILNFLEMCATRYFYKHGTNLKEKEILKYAMTRTEK